MQKCDCLRSLDEGVFCYLVNCQILSDKILCGCARFQGGISGEIDLVDETETIRVRIKVPQPVKNVFTIAAQSSKMDDLIIELA